MLQQQLARRMWASLLGIASLTAPLAVPILDASEVEPTANVEPSHDPGRCGRLHDHAACVQIVKSSTAASAGCWRPPQDGSLAGGATLAPRRVTVDRPAASPLTARAPPILLV